MIALWFLIGVLVQTSSEPFTQFTYCHEYPGMGPYERQCIQLNLGGAGTSRIKGRDVVENSRPFSLSPAGRDKFLALLAATRNLVDSKAYESKRKVANLGRKQLILEFPSEKREAEFNYSDIKEVNALCTFLDAILNQEALITDLDIAAQYERLSVPERLQQLESELRAGRIGDPPGVIPALERIIQNDRILTYAREYALALRNRLINPK